jgi:cell division protein ZapA
MGEKVMSDPKDDVEVTVLGRKITLRSDGDEDYIREVAQYVDEKMDDAQESTKSSTLNVAILAAMNIAHDYFKVVGENKRAFAQVEQQCVDLINYIDSKL